jgi:hypothetical protein
VSTYLDKVDLVELLIARRGDNVKDGDDVLMAGRVSGRDFRRSVKLTSEGYVVFCPAHNVELNAAASAETDHHRG